MRLPLVALLLVAAACARRESPRKTANDADCFGAGSPVVIGPDRIGSLPLDTPLGVLRHRCAMLRWTTTTGDESLDTAIILTRPGLQVVGVMATLANGDSEYRPVRIDSSAHVQLWRVSGTAGILPNGVPLTATWRDLSRAYGELRGFALNGVVYVTICRQARMSILMPIPNINAPINGAPAATVDSVMATTRIETVLLRLDSLDRALTAC